MSGKTLTPGDPLAQSIEDLAHCVRLVVECLCRVWPGDLTDTARNDIVARCRAIELRLGREER